MKTTLFEKGTFLDKLMMLDPNGSEQNSDILQLIKEREFLDKEISKLVAQRKEFNDLILKNCNHPINKRAIESYHLTDTLGNNGWDEITLSCRDCGKNLKNGRHDDFRNKINYYEIKYFELEELLRTKECTLSIINANKIENYVVFVLKNPYKEILIKISKQEKIDDKTLKIKFEIL
jgi:hypothetical protein